MHRGDEHDMSVLKGCLETTTITSYVCALWSAMFDCLQTEITPACARSEVTWAKPLGSATLIEQLSHLAPQTMGPGGLPASTQAQLHLATALILLTAQWMAHNGWLALSSV